MKYIFGFHCFPSRSFLGFQTVATCNLQFLIFPMFFLKKSKGVYCYHLCLSVHPSVYPLCYILLNRRKKFNQWRIRNQYNQAPHLTQDTNWESNKNTIKSYNREPRGQPIPSRWPQGNNEQTWKQDKQETQLTKMIHKRTSALGTVSKKIPSLTL